MKRANLLVPIALALTASALGLASIALASPSVGAEPETTETASCDRGAPQSSGLSGVRLRGPLFGGFQYRQDVREKIEEQAETAMGCGDPAAQLEEHRDECHEGRLEGVLDWEERVEERMERALERNERLGRRLKDPKGRALEQRSCVSLGSGAVAHSSSAFSGTHQGSLQAMAGQTIVLRYRAEVRQGALTFALKGPGNQTIWEKRLDEDGGDTVEHTAEESGLYAVSVAGQRVRGMFEVSWTLK